LRPRSLSRRRSSGNSYAKPSSYRTQATGSDNFSRAPDRATMRSNNRDRPEVIAHEIRILLMGCSDHPDLLTDPRILQM
jgi:hypothetical protein